MGFDKYSNLIGVFAFEGVEVYFRCDTIAAMVYLNNICPKCNAETVIAIDGSCTNRVKGGLCGFRLPFNQGVQNRTFRGKVIKHTNQPTDTRKECSWTSSEANYLHYQLETARNGGIYYDPHNKYLLSYYAPSGATQIAQRFVPGMSLFESVSGVVMPLNSLLQNTHARFENYRNNFVAVASGSNVTISHPSVTNSQEYHVTESGKIIFKYENINGVWQVIP